MYPHARGQVLTTESILLSIRGGVNCQDQKRVRADHNACVLQNLLCHSFLPSPAEHLVVTRKSELALALAKKRVADH